MDFEAPTRDFMKEASASGVNCAMLPPNSRYKFHPRIDTSPLLRRNNSTNFDQNNHPMGQNGGMQNRNKSGNNPQYNNSMRNRLGHKNSYRNNNTQNNAHGTNGNVGTHFNRKRISENANTGPMAKRKWNNKKPYYQQNSNNFNNRSNSAQNRLNRIRINNVEPDQQIVIQNSSPGSSNTGLTESQDLDVADITVQVVNHNAQANEDLTPARFKMLLDAKTQNAIRMIQQKRKDKQVIFPFPVTPNTTEISLHERFALL